MKNPLVSITSVLENLFKKKSSHFSEIYFLFQLKHVWNQIAGSEISKLARPKRYKNNNLFLYLPDSAYLQEMHFAKEALKKNINDRFPDANIKKIILTAGKYTH